MCCSSSESERKKKEEWIVPYSECSHFILPKNSLKVTSIRCWLWALYVHQWNFFFFSLCSWHFCLFITISWMNGQEKKRQFMYEYIEWNSNKMWAETESVITGSWSNNLYKKCARGRERERVWGGRQKRARHFRMPYRCWSCSVNSLEFEASRGLECIM